MDVPMSYLIWMTFDAVYSQFKIEISIRKIKKDKKV